jgi:hypothetical protein
MAAMVADKHRDAAALYRLVQPLRRDRRIGHGLFDQRRHTAFDTIQRDSQMNRVGRRDDRAVRLFSLKQFAEVRMPGKVIRCCKRLGPSGRVGDAGDDAIG